MNIQLNIPALLKFKLSALICMIDFNYSRLCIAYYEIQGSNIVLWLEDGYDMVNSLSSCLKLEIPLENLVPIVSPDDVPIENHHAKHLNGELRYGPKVIERTVTWFTKVMPSQKKIVIELLLTSLMNQVLDDRKKEIYA